MKYYASITTRLGALRTRYSSPLFDTEEEAMAYVESFEPYLSEYEIISAEGE